VISEPEQLVLELQQAALATSRLVNARLAEGSLTASEINVLANMSDGQFRTVGEIGALTGIQPTTLTNILDRLTKRGYLLRELNLADRRSFLLHLTPEGGQAAERAGEAMAGVVRDAAGAFTEADVAAFRKVLHALTEAAR
jgi:MarR family transcriptional regulator, organic hydroperoxide resistance regulator